MKRHKTEQSPDRRSTDQDTNKARRRLLQGLTIGGAVVTAKSLPEQWTRPMVEAIVLPTHAQTSPQEELLRGDTFFSTDIILEARNGREPEVRLVAAAERHKSLLDYFISPAHATLNMTVIADASLAPDGTCIVRFDLNGTADCGEGPEPSVEATICVAGQFSGNEVGETTILSDGCGNAYEAEILAYDGSSGLLSVTFETEPQQIDLTSSANAVSCPACEGDLFDIFDDACSIQKEL